MWFLWLVVCIELVCQPFLATGVQFSTKALCLKSGEEMREHILINNSNVQYVTLTCLARQQPVNEEK